MSGLLSSAEIAAAAEHLCQRANVNARYEAAPVNSGAHWDAIRDAWALQMDGIAAGERHDAYFLSWKFTPIERNAWADIRTLGVPLYPQCPVAGVFIDFADPHLKIGLELDGREFHDRERDTLRDERLWTRGWRIFRITGAESYRIRPGPLDEDFCDDDLQEWAQTTIEGVIWSLGHVYYGRRFRAAEFGHCIALATLNRHRLAAFPISLDGAED